MYSQTRKHGASTKKNPYTRYTSLQTCSKNKFLWFLVSARLMCTAWVWNSFANKNILFFPKNCSQIFKQFRRLFCMIYTNKSLLFSLQRERCFQRRILWLNGILRHFIPRNTTSTDKRASFVSWIRERGELEKREHYHMFLVTVILLSLAGLTWSEVV